MSDMRKSMPPIFEVGLLSVLTWMGRRPERKDERVGEQNCRGAQERAAVRRWSSKAAAPEVGCLLTWYV